MLFRSTFQYLKAYFKRETGKDLNLFVINKFKKRNAKHAIYMEKYNANFQLDIQEVNKFVEWLNK